MIVPPAIAEAFYGYEHNQAVSDTVFQRISSGTAIQAIARAEELVIPDDRLFDTVYDLNGMGR